MGVSEQSGRMKVGGGKGGSGVGVAQRKATSKVTLSRVRNF